MTPYAAGRKTSFSLGMSFLPPVIVVHSTIMGKKTY
jgi:hypothetical protein